MVFFFACILGERRITMPSDISELYRRFLNRDCTENELQKLFEGFGTTDEKKLRALIAAELDAGGETYLEQGDKFSTLFQNIDRTIDRNEHKRSSLILWRRIASVAAMITLAVCVYLWYHSQVEWVTVKAPFGKRLEVTLPDQSHVWLNSGGAIRYPSKYEGGKRIVAITDGEAFFEVVHLQNVPFIVHASESDVEVLGTSFEVVDLKNALVTKVAVLTGKVGVFTPGTQGKTTFLEPGQQALVNHHTHAIVRLPVDMADIAAWRNGRLVFDDQTLAEVFSSLERAYNIKIQVDNRGLLDRRVTMRLENQPLTNVLSAISFSHHFSFRQINDQLIVVK